MRAGLAGAGAGIPPVVDPPLGFAPHPTLLPPRLPAPAPVPPAGGGLGYASPPLQQPLRPPPLPPGGVGPSFAPPPSQPPVIAGYELLPPQPAATATTAALETATTAPTVAAAPPRAIGVVNAPLQAQYSTHVIGSDTPAPAGAGQAPQGLASNGAMNSRSATETHALAATGANGFYAVPTGAARHPPLGPAYVAPLPPHMLARAGLPLSVPPPQSVRAAAPPQQRRTASSSPAAPPPPPLIAKARLRIGDDGDVLVVRVRWAFGRVALTKVPSRAWE